MFKIPFTNKLIIDVDDFIALDKKSDRLDQIERLILDERIKRWEIKSKLSYVFSQFFWERFDIIQYIKDLNEALDRSRENYRILESMKTSDHAWPEWIGQ